MPVTYLVPNNPAFFLVSFYNFFLCSFQNILHLIFAWESISRLNTATVAAQASFLWEKYLSRSVKHPSNDTDIRTSNLYFNFYFNFYFTISPNLKLLQMN